MTTQVNPEGDPGAIAPARHDDTAAARPPQDRGVSGVLAKLEKLLVRRETGPVVGIIILAIIFQIASHGGFLTTNELSGVVTLGAPLIIVSVGVCVLMISGEFDLSVAGTYAVAPIVMGKLMIDGWNGWIAFAAAILCGVAVGLFNGLITTRFGIPSLITSLAALYILEGLAYDITNGQTILLPGGQSFMVTIFGAGGGNTFLSAIMLWAIGISVVLWFLLQHTRYGNWIFASGDRNNAGRAMGVPTKRVKTINFVMCAVLAAFAGCLQFASFGGASPGNGSGYELLAIVSCVIGGTSLFGVKGTVVGAFIGALTVACLQTGLVLIGAPGNTYESLIGLILVITVIANQRIAGSHGLARRLAPWLTRRPEGSTRD